MTEQPSIHAVIFDLGGVLLRTDDPQPRTALAERLGLTRSALENIIFNNPVALRAEQGQATPDQVWMEIARLLDLPFEQMPEINRQFFGGDRVDFSLIALIQRLRPTYTTALLSNTWNVHLENTLRESLKITDTFDVIISSAAEEIAKPDPRIYQIALEKVKSQPEEAVLVDDNVDNIEGAAALGIRTIRFTSADQARCELLELVQVP